MNLNRLIFPSPEPSYTPESFLGEIIYIPRSFKPETEGLEEEQKFSASIFNSKPAPSHEAIPCLYLPYSHGSSKLMIYFHGNAEDIGLAYELLDHLRNTLKLHVLAVEYPGYGIYGGTADAQRILEDARLVFDYLTLVVGHSASDIFLFGRSMGSGPATELAAKRKPGALLLMSAYTSIRGVARSLAGKVSQYLIAERFKNIDHIRKVSCPTFLVHGQKDSLIPFQHSEELHRNCGGPSSLLVPAEMDHNEFDFYDDLS